VKLLLDTQLPLWAAGQPDRPAIHFSGDSAIGYSGMEMETLVRYNGGIGPGMPEIPEHPMFNMKPNSLIYSARYDRTMEAFGGKQVGWVERRETHHRSPDRVISSPGSPAQSTG
jgi:hypothetical protein